MPQTNVCQISNSKCPNSHWDYPSVLTVSHNLWLKSLMPLKSVTPANVYRQMCVTHQDLILTQKHTLQMHEKVIKGLIFLTKVLVK